MKSICFCFLAIGDRYVHEFKSIATNFPKENIIVCSDRKIDDYNTIIHDGEFNFNLKSIPIIEGLKKYEKVVFLDTDHYINKFDINYFNTFEKGISVKWIGDKVVYLNENISADMLINGTTSRDDVNNYGKILSNLYDNIKFIDESFLVFNLKDKDNFIKNYLMVIEKTKNTQPYRDTDKKKGALEGCLLYTATKLSNEDILSSNSKFIKNFFYHYGPELGHSIKLKKELL